MTAIHPIPMPTERGEPATTPPPSTRPLRLVVDHGGRERGEHDTMRGPGAAVVMVVLDKILTAAERLLRMFDDPHAAIAIPLRGSDVPPDLDAVARAAWAVAVGPDGSGPGAPAVILALTHALTIADLLRRSGDDPHQAIALPLRYGAMPPRARVRRMGRVGVAATRYRANDSRGRSFRRRGHHSADADAVTTFLTRNRRQRS